MSSTSSSAEPKSSNMSPTSSSAEPKSSNMSSTSSSAEPKSSNMSSTSSSAGPKSSNMSSSSTSAEPKSKAQDERYPRIIRPELVEIHHAEGGMTYGIKLRSSRKNRGNPQLHSPQPRSPAVHRIFRGEASPQEAMGLKTAADPTPMSSKTPAEYDPIVPIVSQAMITPADTLYAAVMRYKADTPHRTKLMDGFLGFLVVVGGLQLAYCVFGNYPFNAFLAGFGATVGQFVLTVNLRIQTNPVNHGEFSRMSPERAFVDFVVTSAVLHLLCAILIN